ncbi:response regulator [Sphingomonas sp. MMS24-JH45]
MARHILEVRSTFPSPRPPDGREALAHCRGRNPDVILLDWNMPVMSGMEFLRALGAEPMEPRPKVVFFCTTENGMAHIRAAIEAGGRICHEAVRPRDAAEQLQIVGVA